MAAIETTFTARQLSGVSKTMLWALHNRAIEAARPDGVLKDPDSVKIHQAIDYDFDRTFGPPAGSLAARAAEIDQRLQRWIAVHPNGFVVSLGEGLETQCRRVDNGRIRWLSVDLPDAIALRNQFIPPTHRFRHAAISVLDPDWMNLVDPSEGVIIVAQGLLMYLHPETVAALFRAIARRFPGAELVFDVVPKWFSHLTLLGLNQTPHYRLPPMPWGINRDEVENILREWLPSLDSVQLLDYGAPRGLPLLMARMLPRLPFARHEPPCLVHVVLAGNHRPSNIIPFRNQPMASIDGVMEVATRNASSNGELAVAAGQIIAKRVALGMAAAVNPLLADHAEFNRMVPEKVQAFSEAGRILMREATEVGVAVTRFASDAMMTSTRATFAMARSTDPISLAEKQTQLAVALFQQATANVMAMGLLALGAHEAAMVPIRETIEANTKRLG